MRLPSFLLRHTVTVEPLVGTYSHGPSYGAPVSYKCYVEDRTTLVLNREGKEVVSTSAVFLQLGPSIPVDSRVTVNGRESIVIDVKERNGKGLPTPDHLELILR